MQKLVRALGILLVLTGASALGYAGYSFMHRPSGASASWSTSQHRAGAEIASRYGSVQRVSLPKSLASSPTARPGQEPALRMAIPKIAVNAPVVQTPPTNGVWDVADWAVGHLTTTPNPGAPGNAAYSAHDDIKGEVFKRLGEVKPGDSIVLYTKHSKYTYTITNELTVDPSNISVLNPTKSSTVTLISCSPYWVDTQRLIIQASLKSVSSI